MENNMKDRILSVGQRVQLTDHGVGVAGPRGVRAWRKKHGPSKPITGTITDIIAGVFVVKMDGEFSCLSHGRGFNTFLEEHIAPLE
jgi:hypothetical protein